MSLARHLTLIVFIESFATTLVMRGIYFVSRSRLGFTDEQNLCLALASGAAYIVGALVSHRISLRLGEKRVLVAAIAGLFLSHTLLASCISPLVLFLGASAVGLLTGVKWPLVTTYFGAGLGAAETARSIGRFNVAWASAMPFALTLSGPLISGWSPGIFALAGLLNAASLWLMRPLRARPTYLAHDDPARPDAGVVLRYQGLLVSARWLLVASCSASWILAPLLPRIFDELAVTVIWAAPLAGLIDLSRLAVFILLRRLSGWHNRASPLLLAVVMLPMGFFAVLSGMSIVAVLAGEVLVGLIAGLAYHAALYYAMVTKNGSVAAGGGHHGVAGIAIVMGPSLGLLGRALVVPLKGLLLGNLAGVGPLFVICAAGAVRALIKSRRGRDRTQQAP